MDLKQHIRGIPDFPTPGILFYDISPLLAHPQAWQATVARLAEIVHRHEPDVLAGIESRGFLVAAPLALRLTNGFFLVPKNGQLPGPHLPSPHHIQSGPDHPKIPPAPTAPPQQVTLL